MLKTGNQTFNKTSLLFLKHHHFIVVEKFLNSLGAEISEASLKISLFTLVFQYYCDGVKETAK